MNEKKDKIIYSLEMRRVKGKYECEYNNYLETATDNFVLLKMLHTEIDKILNDNVTEYSIGNKGIPFS